ncbi:hypothetical protein ACO1O0_003534 [Amphichorda felina]
MKLQTAPLIHELEDGHEYEFVQAAIETSMTKGIEALTSPDNRFYAFYDPADLEGTLQRTLSQLDEYISHEGPFDMVMGFSAGAVTAALYMLEKQRQGAKVPFRGAVFLSSASSEAERAHLCVGTGGDDVLRAPTAHIWGSADEDAPTGGWDLARICDSDRRQILIHDGGHELPRKEYLTQAVHVIRRMLLDAKVADEGSG